MKTILIIVVTLCEFALTDEWTWYGGQTTNIAFYGQKGAGNSLTFPQPTYLHLSFSHEDCFYIFSGVQRQSVNTPLTNDLWTYNFTTNIWTWLSGTNGTSPFYVSVGNFGNKSVESPTNIPEGRKAALGAVSPQEKLVYVYGGLNSGGSLSDLWTLNLTDNYWTWHGGYRDSPVYPAIKGQPQGSATPGCRCYSASWVDGSKNFWIFGGFIQNNNYTNELWYYNQDSGWIWMSGSSTANDPGNYTAVPVGTPSILLSPSARPFPSFWIDSSSRLVFIFGGTPTSELWKSVDITGYGR